VDTDLKLRKRVIQELEWDPAIDATRLSVDVHDGVVSLSGTASSLAEKAAAEDAVKRLRGVRAVVEGIEIVVPDEGRRADAAIAEAAANALEWDAHVPHERVSIAVEHGVITLEGEIEWQYQRDAISRALARLTGVRHVDNRLRVVAPAGANTLQADIAAAIGRSARLGRSDIRIEVMGRRVLLTGEVDSWSQSEEAERIAWAAPGIEAVDNNLTIRLPETDMA
jgi:osmotically-inducible protein OsmY